MLDYVILITIIVSILILKCLYEKDIWILFNENKFNLDVLKNLDKKIKSYYPNLFLYNFWFKVFYNIIPNIKKINFEKIFIKTRDNAEIKLELFGNDFDNKPLVVFKYGLNGNSNCKYTIELTNILMKNNFNIIVVNDRSIDNNYSHKLFGHYDLNDFEDTIDFINKKFKNCKKFLLGVSMGANYLTKYLGETKQNHNIKAACIIGNPFDWLKTCFFMDKTIYGKVISRFFIKEFKDYLEKTLVNNPNYNDWLNNYKTPLHKIKLVKSLFNFDNNFAKRMCGYDSVYDYYEDCQSSKFVKSIKTKTLFINSLNDKISRKENIPINDIIKNENLILLMFKNGGHIEFFNGINPKFFGFELAVDYFKEF